MSTSLRLILNTPGGGFKRIFYLWALDTKMSFNRSSTGTSTGESQSGTKELLLLPGLVS